MENENKIKKVIFNEVSLFIAGIGLISSIIFWVTNPQNDMQIQIIKLQSQMESNQTVIAALEKIKNNDFVEIHIKMKEIEENQIKILIAITRLETIVNKK